MSPELQPFASTPSPCDRAVLARAAVRSLARARARRPCAALYKWTDANGRVVYSDQPPPAVKAESQRGRRRPRIPKR